MAEGRLRNRMEAFPEGELREQLPLTPAGKDSPVVLRACRRRCPGVIFVPCALSGRFSAEGSGKEDEMAVTAYCKKCNREVEPGDICPRCGTKLPKTAVHAAWVVERRPVTDWMCWNAVMRWLLPAGLSVLLLALVLEGLSGGMEAVERLFRGSFPATLLMLLCFTILLVALALLLQGRELMDYVVDSRGVHVTRYVPQPTALKLLARLKSPRLLDQVNWEAEAPVLRLEERDLPWREVVRVQLWPEKCYILFYAPAWWLRIPVRCTPFSWEDALVFVRDKLGKKKKVELPVYLRTPAAPKVSAAAPQRRSVPVPVPEEEEDGPAWPPREPEPAAGARRRSRPDPVPEEEDAGTAEEEAAPAEESRAAGTAEETVPSQVGEQMTLDI